MSAFQPSPWARRALGITDENAIAARAEALGARLVAGGGPGVFGPWTVHATSQHGGIYEGVVHAKGQLALVITGVLDRFAIQRDIVDEDLADLGWTNEEILTVAHQSGLLR